MLSLLLGATMTIQLWPGDAPLARGKAPHDIPNLTVYRSAKPNGAAVMVLPGGGYWILAPHEGKDYALWLNRLGITAFVLQYRLHSNGYSHPAPFLDAARGMRLIRSRAAEFGIDPAKIGVMGSSAGGHLSSTFLTHFEPEDLAKSDRIEAQSSRPDFGILCYPVISFSSVGHSGSREALLGKKPDPALVKFLSGELNVKEDTPPCFLWHCYDDTGVKPENSLLFAAALREKGVPVELHLYEKGGHGIGLGGSPDSDRLLPWTVDLAAWLKQRGWAESIVKE